MNRHLSAAALATAFIISACGAALPASLPTAIPPGATATPAPKAAPAATQAAPAAGQPAAAPAGDRPFSKLAPAQRTSIATAPPAMTIDVTKLYIATIKTSKGNIVVELDPSAAPKTVNNFVFLSQNGFYDGLTFHRVEPQFVIQGGDPMGSGQGGPGYTVPAEIKLAHVDGAIAMARLSDQANPERASSGSQFYLTMGAQSFLDGGYTAFGRTTAGLDVIRKIAVGDKIDRIDIAVGGPVGSGAPAVAAAPAAPAAPAGPAPTLPPAAPAECRILTDTFGIEQPEFAVQKDDHVFGNKDAPSTLIEYGDPQCPACAAFQPVLKNVINTYSDTLRVVYRHFPLISIHDKSRVSAIALEAAGQQGKFAEMQELLFAKQADWTTVPVTDFNKTLAGYAGELKLDLAAFTKAMADPAMAARVDRDVTTADALGLQETPTLILDGQPLQTDVFNDPKIEATLRSYLGRRVAYRTYLASKPVRFAKPDAVSDGKSIYEVTLKTSKGDIIIEIDPKIAPVNVNSFLFLAQKGYYNNTQVQLNDPAVSAALFSDPSATGYGYPGYECDSELETAPAAAFTEAGTVALFRSTGPNPDASGSQIILTYGVAPQLQGGFTTIGKVTKGLDLVKTLVPDGGTGPADKIVSVTVTKKG